MDHLPNTHTIHGTGVFSDMNGWFFCGKCRWIILYIDAMGRNLHPGKLTWQWKTDQLKMYLLLNMAIFHCHASFGGVDVSYNNMAYE